MPVKVGINGFGRIGRNVVRAALNNPEIEFVAVNDLTDVKTLAHMTKYDSLLGPLPEPVTVDGDTIVIGSRRIKVFAEKDPALIDWNSVGAEIIIESTGRFVDKANASKHIRGSVKKVIISAPAKDEDVTIVLGVNDDAYDPAKHHVVSNASCTTNCLAPVCKVLHEKFGIDKGSMTTIHSYTNDQVILDFPHSDLRRARAAALSMIPTSTGAAKAIYLAIPELKGKLDGFAVRVPTPNVSAVDLVTVVGRNVTVEEVNAALKAASEAGPLKNVFNYTDEELVSSDFKGDAASSTLDSKLTRVIGGNLVKTFAWYDNEWGYSNRVKDLITFFGEKGL